MSTINNLSSNYLQSILNNTLQNTTSTNDNPNGIDTSSIVPQPDNSNLSPFAQLIGTLQQLQQTDPAKYQQVTQQIATNLDSAAQSAQAAGDTTAASQLTKLADDFTSASKSGQLPNIPDLAQAIGGHHGHGHHHHHAETASPSTDPTSTTGTSSTDPASIIFNTLADAGTSSAP
ncbi:MAG TPA: hypothetical protein VGJ09_01575 [Bryobacteraceae bacterium]